MAESERADSGHPLISNPKEFLTKPFVGLEVGKLIAPPSLELLKWLPSLKEEAGLVLVEPDWFVIKASDRGVPSFLMPATSDVLLHSHPSGETTEENDGRSIPSLGDFFNCSPTAQNLISTPVGITQYWYVNDFHKRKIFEAELLSMKPRFTDIKSSSEYLDFLKENDAKFEVYPWDKITEQKLNELLSPKK